MIYNTSSAVVFMNLRKGHKGLFAGFCFSQDYSKNRDISEFTKSQIRHIIR
jgi:hypothetical protein